MEKKNEWNVTSGNCGIFPLESITMRRAGEVKPVKERDMGNVIPFLGHYRGKKKRDEMLCNEYFT